MGRVAKFLPDWKVLRFSLFGTGLVMFVYFFSPTDTTLYLYLTIPFFTFFNGLSMANMGSLVSRSAEMGRQGQAMGIFSSVQNLAQVPASILVGYIATSITSATPLIVSGSCISAGGLLFLLAFRPKYVNDAPAVPGAVPVH